MKNKMKQLFGIILSLVLVLGLMPGMSLTTLAENPYAALKNTTTPVKFDGKDWYLIDYDDSTVTLLSKEYVGASVFNTTTALGNAYSGSTVETAVNTYYNDSISSDVKSAVVGDGMFLLTKDQANAMTDDTRKCTEYPGTESNYWWLCSPANYGYAECVRGDYGNVHAVGSPVNLPLGVRPALKLDLSSVIFESNTFTVGSKVDVTGVTLNKTAVTLTVNSTESLTATVAPDNATDKTITWLSDNTAVATVSDGVVTAVAEGTANITVTATNGTEDTSDDKTATCAVKVNAPASSGGSSDSGSTSGGSSDSGSGSSSSGSSDNTNTNTDTSAKVPYEEVAISTGSVTDITGTAAATAESNPFATKIENNSNLTTLLSLTDAEVAQGVNVWLDIQDMSSSVSKTDKSKIEKKSGDYTVGMYLDINLFKKVGNNDATKVTETNGKIKASIVIPKKLRKSGRTFEIIRVHNGKATTITGKYTKKTHVFTFETDKFSTYAIAYKDAASSTDSESTDSSSSATTTTTTASTGSTATTATAPKTGDPNDVRVWYLLFIASLGGLGFLGYSKKKKEND